MNSTGGRIAENTDASSVAHCTRKEVRSKAVHWRFERRDLDARRHAGYEVRRQKGLTALRVCLLAAPRACKATPATFLELTKTMAKACYHYVATSLAGFLQQLAVHYMGHGYLFFVTGNIPEGKDPARTDAKILSQYPIAVSRWARARRKQAGLGNVHYIRYGRFFVILATHGTTEFFEGEGPEELTEEEKRSGKKPPKSRIRDARQHAVNIGPYSVSVRRGADRQFHPSVCIHPERYRELKAYFVEIAVNRSSEALRSELWRLNFEPFAPVRRQLLSLLRLVNRARQEAGLPACRATA